MSYLNTYYYVTINKVPGLTGDADGFIDNAKVEQYMAWGYTPVSLTTSTNKVKGNIRYKTIIEQLELMGGMVVSNVSVANGSVDNVANSITFSLTSTFGDNVLFTVDELSSNSYVLTGNAAITRCVARGMNQVSNHVVTIYDPTTTTAPQNGATSNAMVRVGSRTVICNVASLSNSLLTSATYVSVNSYETFNGTIF